MIDEVTPVVALPVVLADPRAEINALPDSDGAAPLSSSSLDIVAGEDDAAPDDHGLAGTDWRQGIYPVALNGGWPDLDPGIEPLRLGIDRHSASLWIKSQRLPSAS